MKDTDRTSYNDLLKAEQTADNDSDPSEKFKVYAKAYNWAYGDIFDRKLIVISTDEIKLLHLSRIKTRTLRRSYGTVF